MRTSPINQIFWERSDQEDWLARTNQRSRGRPRQRCLDNVIRDPRKLEAPDNWQKATKKECCGGVNTETKKDYTGTRSKKIYLFTLSPFAIFNLRPFAILLVVPISFRKIWFPLKK